MNSVATNLLRSIGLPTTGRPNQPAEHKARPERTSGQTEQAGHVVDDHVATTQQETPTRLSIHLYSPGDDSKIIPNALGGTVDLKG